MEKITPNQLKIISFVTEQNFNLWQKITHSWERYFIFEHQFVNPENITNFLNSKIDFLFLDVDFLHHFKQFFYEKFRHNNLNFNYVVLSKKNDWEQEIKIFKALADDIIDLNRHESWIKWKTVALLRRRWATHSKPTTIIYKNIIADFIDNFISIEGNTIFLTPKEFKLFRFLLENRGQYKTRSQIFEAVWNYQGVDNTRVVDQIMFKIKQKIGHEYFENNRKKGIKFE